MSEHTPTQTEPLDVGPMYRVKLIDSLPLGSSGMDQCMPDRDDLLYTLECTTGKHTASGNRVVAGYEVLLAHYHEAKAKADAHDDLVAVAKAYEQWEADLVCSSEAWAPDGMAEFPRIVQPLWDRLMEIQSLRLAAMKKATANE